MPIALAGLLVLGPGGMVAAETHVVQPGETLFGMGLSYGVSPESIAEANGISDPSLLQIGQMLTIPTSGESANSDSSVYVVVAGDTLSEIGQSFGVAAAAIAAANGIDEDAILSIGQELTIPTRPNLTTRHGQRLSFVWPAYGPITAYFGEPGWLWRTGYHTGLDLGVSYGSVVQATEAGVVLEAEHDYISGYGTYIKIGHGNGLITLYGHLSDLMVDPGQAVDRGETIGLSGNSGYSTGPHLHFEVRMNGEPVDPLLYLP